MVADRLDVPVDYVEAQARRARSPPRGPIRARGAAAAAPDLAEPEITFLALCLAAGRAGREQLDRARPTST